jgi:hypothetical protein
VKGEREARKDARIVWQVDSIALVK